MSKLINELKYDLTFLRSHTLQPEWFKVLKVFLMVGFLGGYGLLFGWVRTFIFGLIFFGLMLGVHFLYRARTRRYTQSWLDFSVYEEDGERKYKRIGTFYYAVSLQAESSPLSSAKPETFTQPGRKTWIFCEHRMNDSTT
jgi:hypothetical protein